jgi:putative ABC transport system permease protein
MRDLLLNDVRWAIRQAVRRPGLSLAMVGTLAATIAAVTTVYGLATAILWRPLPFADAGRVVFLWEQTGSEAAVEPARVTAGRYGIWRDSSRAFTSMAIFGAAGFSIEEEGHVSSVRGLRVQGPYFETLGIRPLIGRALLPEDETPGRHEVAVLSYDFWQRRFEGRHQALGETIRFSGRPYTIVGVMPPVVFPGWPVNPASVTIGADTREFWVPMTRNPEADLNWRSHVYGVVARLAPGVTLSQAADDLQRLSSPSDPDPHGAQISPLREQFVGDARRPLLTLLSAALAVLLIACINLAALNITAFESRRPEMSVRVAIGAGVGRLTRQVLVEALVPAVLGGIIGIGLARAALLAVPGYLPPNVPLLTSATLDFGVAAFAAGLTLTAALVLAAWPIGRLLWAGPAPRGVARTSRRGVYRGLVVSQVAVTVALVAAAGLLAQSLWSVRSRDPGFIVDRLLVAEIGLPAASFDTAPRVTAAENRIGAAIAARPGVSAVAFAYDQPLESNWTDAYTLEGDPGGGRDDANGQAHLRIVSPEYFETLGVAILEGRGFGPLQGFDAPGVAMVNEAFAAAHGGRVIGRRLHSAAASYTWGDAAPRDFEIVGIVENERFRGLEEPSAPAFYLSTRQFPQRDFAALVRTSVGPGAIAGDVRTAARGAEATATVAPPVALSSLLDDQLVTRRVTTDVIGGLAGIALALAALGLYGLVAVTTAGRTREIGVRLALGASPRGVARGVVQESLVNAVFGLLLGLGLALVAGRLLEGLLVDVTGRDPVTLTAVAAILIAVAVAAALVPAQRAARVNPAVALRSD